jgi:predicted dehydrogenase
VAQANTDVLEIFGSEGSLRYEVYPDKLYGARGSESFTPVEIREEDAYNVTNWRVERDFIDAIRHGSQYHPNFDDGLKYMETIQAVYDSARTGRVVEIG